MNNQPRKWDGCTPLVDLGIPLPPGKGLVHAIRTEEAYHVMMMLDSIGRIQKAGSMGYHGDPSTIRRAVETVKFLKAKIKRIQNANHL